MGFKAEVLCKLNSIEERIKSMSEIIDQLAGDVTASFSAITVSLTDMGASLSNIAADEARQAAQIQELIAQVEAGGIINSADLDKLVALRNNASAMAQSVQGVADHAKAVADSIPEPAPPTP